MRGKKLTIEEVKELAQSRNGVCLSEVYLGAEFKLQWKCEQGHIFEATPHSVKRGRWCKICSWEKQKLKIEDLHKIAKKKGGRCLSKKYVNAITKLKWKCKNGHIFEAAPYVMKRGNWCKQCSWNKRKLKIEDMHELAESKGGKCLSPIYKNKRTKLIWKCSGGHTWEATPDVITRGHWCPACAQNQTLTIEEMQKLAKERGGKCLSDCYINSNTKLIWQCSVGHIWEATPGNIKRRKSWCPYCSNNFSSEEICRVMFETLFEFKFPKARPFWLVNDKGNRMELDGYCKELKLAFEHHGDQHFRKIEFFGNNRSFEQQKKNDELKRKMCNEKGISIIYINQLNEKVKLEDLKDYIIDQCIVLGLRAVAQRAKSIEINHPPIYSSYSEKILSQLKIIAKSKGGECLSDIYINNNFPLKWKCSKGHVWETAPVNIKNMGHWCPDCSGNQRLTIEVMRQVAMERGGACLSEKYINKDTKLLWKCSKGHTWKASLRNVKGNGTWCPVCAGKQIPTIEDMRTIARKKDGDCLSKEYIDSKTKLLWKCSKGHTWATIPNDIKQGKWCPKCAKNQRLTINEMKQLASENGGQCLSEEYVNSKTKLLWKCTHGHTWTATPNNVKNGKWCPHCYRFNRIKNKDFTVHNPNQL